MAVRGKVRLWVAVALALVLLVGAMTAVVALSFREAPRRTLVFADGSRLTVVGASMYGEGFTTDKRWQATLRRWLPGGLQRWLPVEVTVPATLVSSPTDAINSNSLCVWFMFVDAKGTNSAASLSSSGLSWTWNASVAEDGFRFSAMRTSMGSLMAAGARVWRLQLFSFPRRQREFELQFFDMNMKLLGSVSVPNPKKGPFPEWTPERLPNSRTNGSLVMTLEGLSETHQINPPFECQVIPQYYLSSPDGERLTSSFVTLNWQWADPTGNIREPLDYQEKAWRFSVQFRPANTNRYFKDEGFVIAGLKVPDPGTLQVLTNEFERLGIKFKLRCLAGAGTLAATNGGGLSMLTSDSTPSAAALRNPRNISGGFAGDGPVQDPEWTPLTGGRNPVRTMVMSRPFFLLQASQPNSWDAVGFRVVGSDGRALLPLTAAQAMSSIAVRGSTAGLTNRTYAVPFDAASVTGTISLEVHVNGPRTFEFFVDPKDVKRAGR